jgi:hypothetical protein
MFFWTVAACQTIYHNSGCFSLIYGHFYRFLRKLKTLRTVFQAYFRPFLAILCGLSVKNQYKWPKTSLKNTKGRLKDRFLTVAVCH